MVLPLGSTNGWSTSVVVLPLAAWPASPPRKLPARALPCPNMDGLGIGELSRVTYGTELVARWPMLPGAGEPRRLPPSAEAWDDDGGDANDPRECDVGRVEVEAIRERCCGCCCSTASDLRVNVDRADEGPSERVVMGWTECEVAANRGRSGAELATSEPDWVMGGEDVRR